MKVRAVVKLAALRMGLEVRHKLRQLHGLNMVQAKLLKPRRINQCGVARGINPIKRSAGGGVFA